MGRAGVCTLCSAQCSAITNAITLVVDPNTCGLRTSTRVCAKWRLFVGSKTGGCVNKVGGNLSHPMTHQIKKDLHPAGQSYIHGVGVRLFS